MSTENLYICFDDSIKELNISLDFDDLFDALKNPVSMSNEWKKVLPYFCEKLSNEYDSQDIQMILIPLCYNINRELSLNSLCHVIDKKYWGKIDENTCIKFKCLLQLLPFESMCDMIRDFCDNQKEIIIVLDQYYNLED